MAKCRYCSPARCRICFLYVVADRGGGGTVKVGISFRPTRRLGEHRKKTKRDLGLFHKVELRCAFTAIDAEDRALTILNRYRVQGDWFACSVDDAIAAVNKGAGKS